MVRNERRIVLSGWGQIKQDKESTGPLRSPLGLMLEAAELAAERAGARELLRQLDGVMVVRVLSRHYQDAARELAARLGATPRYCSVSGIGGSSPQLLINQAAGMIARGELDTVLVAGGETYYPRTNADVRGSDSLFKGLKGGHERDDMVGASATEMRHGVSLPLQGFPLFETALWAESGQSLESYLQEIGELWSRFSQVASRHPQAWNGTPRSAREITRPNPPNRLVAFPYTKFMTSLITVDLGAAVILMSADRARRTQRQSGLRPVYFRGGAYVEDRQRFPIQRSSFTRSAALEVAARRALRRSGLSIEEMDCFDLYSCFPCSVTIARRALELDLRDERPLTVTGGLGFFGGPGNNYSLHAIATLAQAIARGEVDNGMVTGLGWFLHKHAAGIYSSTPPDRERISEADLEDRAHGPAGSAPEPATERPGRRGVIETYTVLYGRDRRPQHAILYGRDGAGLRFVARAEPRPDVIELLTGRCQVGATVSIAHHEARGVNLAELECPRS